MEQGVLVGIVALAAAVLSGLLLALYFMFAPKRSANLRSMMGSSGLAAGTAGGYGEGRARGEITDEDLERIKDAARKKSKAKPKATLQEKFFHAGMFSLQDRQRFSQLRIIVPCITTPLLILMASFAGKPILLLLGAVFGFLIGLQIPFSILDRRIKARSEDILFFLPLVVEQIVIGVSSGLDAGPCIQRVVQMADERDSHNPVTELLKHTQTYVKSGVSMGDALVEVGRLSGHTELKHTFMSLSQVSKHGGEITRQLQELADSVAAQRETKIEAKIRKLELEATGPVGLVFLGFMLILMAGIGANVMQAFK